MRRSSSIKSNSNVKGRVYIPDWFRPIWGVIRSLGVLLVSGLIVGGFIYSLASGAYESYLSPPDVNDAEPVTFRVERNSTLSQVAENLLEAGLIRNAGVFKYYVDFSGRSDKIQYGVYTFNKSMTLDDLISQLVKGDGLPKTLTFTLREGMSVDEIARHLYDQKIIQNVNTFVKLCEDTGLFIKDYEMLADITPADAEAPRTRRYALEGYLFPAKYEIFVDSGDETIIRKLLTKSVEIYYQNRFQEQLAEYGLTLDQALTMASIIEKEASIGDFTKLSAVLHNRLEKGMKLESEATIRYAAKLSKLVITGEDKNFDSLYNTFKYAGLPPGPICNPSERALAAVFEPNQAALEQELLYYVLTSTDPANKTLTFVATKSEYDELYKTYLPEYEQYDSGTAQ